MTAVQTLTTADGQRIAYHRSAGEGPGVIFCHGLMSDMGGDKALQLEALCQRTNRPFVRFDNLGHGQSSGEFVDGNISQWRDTLLAVIDQLTEGPQVLVGSSMGGWISLLAAQARPHQIAALALVAPAADFTETMFWDEFSEPMRLELQDKGVLELPSDYGEPYLISHQLIEDGRDNLLLDGSIELNIPVRILQGMQDESVPWQHALKISEAVTTADVQVSLIKNGDHRLSTADQLQQLCDVVDGLARTSRG